MQYPLILIALMLTFTACKTGKPKAPSQTVSATKVFLFAGQSNMDGRANGADLSPKDLDRLQKVSNRIRFYYNGQPVRPLQLTIPKPYIQRKFSLSEAFGPELFFGIRLAELHPDEQFIFIKRAQGGTSLHGCWNPDWSHEKANLMGEADKPKLYGEFIEYAREVLGSVATPYKIEAMFWIQGEADSGVKKYGPVPANNYADNLRNLISSIRNDLKVANLPFIMFQVGNGKVMGAMTTVTAQDPDVYLLPQSSNRSSTDYYAKNPPPIGHYTAESMKVIGSRFYDLYAGSQE